MPVDGSKSALPVVAGNTVPVEFDGVSSIFDPILLAMFTTWAAMIRSSGQSHLTIFACDSRLSDAGEVIAPHILARLGIVS